MISFCKGVCMAKKISILKVATVALAFIVTLFSKTKKAK